MTNATGYWTPTAAAARWEDRQADYAVLDRSVMADEPVMRATVEWVTANLLEKIQRDGAVLLGDLRSQVSDQTSDFFTQNKIVVLVEARVLRLRHPNPFPVFDWPPARLQRDVKRTVRIVRERLSEAWYVVRFGS
jgi:hypothetical protein